MGCWGRQLLHGIARNAHPLQQSPHGELRMARGRRDFLAFASGGGAPRIFVEIGIKPGQHDRTARQPCNCSEQLRHLRHQASGYGGNDRLVAACQTSHFGVDKPVASIGGIDRAFFLRGAPANSCGRS